MRPAEPQQADSRARWQHREPLRLAATGDEARRRRIGLLAGIATAALGAGAAQGRTLLAGQGKEYQLPSQAVAAARTGDEVRIAPGTYYDCAIVTTDGLRIVGDADGVVMTDKACEGKAIMVVKADGTTIENVTLRRARVPDGNGAGIRLEGRDLTVTRVRFENDQVGILSGSTGGTVTVTGSEFAAGGIGGDHPTYAMTIGRSDRLVVAGNAFAGSRGGLVSTAARRADIRDNEMTLADDAPVDDLPPTAVLATTGDLVMTGNRITVGRARPTSGASVAAWDEAAPSLTDNRLTNKSGRPMTLLQDWTYGAAVLERNQVGAGDAVVTSDGVVRHRASSEYHLRKDQTRRIAKQAWESMRRLARG